jgi:hypothetical protein
MGANLMSSTAFTPEGVGSSPAGAFTSVLSAAIGTAAAKLERRVVRWVDKLNGVAGGDVAEGLAESVGGGTAAKAGAEAIKSGLNGGNPLWAAIKETWRLGTPGVRAAMVAAAAGMILLLLLSPVLLLVFLLSLLIIAAVRQASAAKK